MGLYYPIYWDYIGDYNDPVEESRSKPISISWNLRGVLNTAEPNKTSLVARLLAHLGRQGVVGLLYTRQ